MSSPVPAANPLAELALVATAAIQVPGTTDAQAAAAWRIWLGAATDVATVIIALALLVATLFLALILLHVRRLVRRVDPLVRQVETHVEPLMGHARTLGENVSGMSGEVRTDLQRALRAAERRLTDFSALLSVMQEEAERVFIDTAAAIRGVQHGAHTLQRLRENEWSEPTSTADAPPQPRNPEPGGSHASPGLG